MVVHGPSKIADDAVEAPGTGRMVAIMYLLALREKTCCLACLVWKSRAYQWWRWRRRKRSAWGAEADCAVCLRRGMSKAEEVVVIRRGEKTRELERKFDLWIGGKGSM
jgi:hypothetical protein